MSSTNRSPWRAALLGSPLLVPCLVLSLGCTVEAGGASGEASSEGSRAASDGTGVARETKVPASDPGKRGKGLRHKTGWELYTWVYDGESELNYCLIIGQGITKPPDVVYTSDPGDGRYQLRGVGAPRLLRALGKLAPGESVVWNPGESPSTPPGCNLTLPPSGVRERVREAAKARSISVAMGG